MCTGHANSAADMLDRLENMILMAKEVPVSSIRRQVASGLDILIHLGRLRDKSRKVLEIVEIVGYDSGQIRYNPLYRFEEEAVVREEGTYGGRIITGKVMGRLLTTGNSLRNVGKLLAAGFDVQGSYV